MSTTANPLCGIRKYTGLLDCSTTGACSMQLATVYNASTMPAHRHAQLNTVLLSAWLDCVTTCRTFEVPLSGTPGNNSTITGTTTTPDSNPPNDSDSVVLTPAPTCGNPLGTGLKPPCGPGLGYEGPDSVQLGSAAEFVQKCCVSGVLWDNAVLLCCIASITYFCIAAALLLCASTPETVARFRLATSSRIRCL